MEIKYIISALEKLAPLSFQESYDNSGLICGSKSLEVNKVLCTLDCTEEVVKEAIDKGCQMVIAHHPIVFKPLKSITNRTYVERALTMAIKADIAIYAIHTNLDHVLNGVNKKLGEKIGLKNMRILSPKRGLLSKLITYSPIKNAESVRNALFEAGAGEIGNYESCSFYSAGTGTFQARKGANPSVGEIGKLHEEQEIKIEVLLETHMLDHVIQKLIDNHPYEEVAYDIIPLANQNMQVGAGMIGDLKEPMSLEAFLKHISGVLKTNFIKHTKTNNKLIRNVAICGGSGSFLLNEAIRANADVFISADFKYHEYFDADEKLVILDVGHFESEQFTPELLKEFLEEKFSTFAVLLSEVKTNPVQYYIS